MKKIRRVTNKKRFQVLLWFIPFFFILFYELAIKATINEYQLYAQYLNPAVKPTSDQDPELLRLKNDELDSSIKDYFLDTVNNNKNLLKVVSELCNDYSLQLKTYAILPASNFDSCTLLTRLITVDGNFKSCLSLIHDLETQNSVGRVSSVQYKTNQNLSDKTYHLLCDIYIQNITSY